MVSQAEVIRDLIQTNWSLTGNLSKVSADDMKEPVFFFDRPQVKGNETVKAIEVVKINNDEEENVTDHPNFIEITDFYDIRIRYRIVDVATQYDQGLADAESMATELISILDTQFSPATSSTGWFISRKRWRLEDQLEQQQPELVRILSFELIQIKGQSDSVFRGNVGVMIFDTSDSVGGPLPVPKPGADYSFTELRELSIIEGFTQIPVLTKDKTRGRKIPHQVNGVFSGVFSSLLFVKRADIDGTTLEKIEHIGQVQASSPLISQIAEVVMLHDTQNTLATPETFTSKSFMRISRADKLTTDESLVAYRLIGTLTQPTQVTMAP